MGRTKRGEIPADLAQGRQRFRAWRRTRKTGRRIPEPLWSLAVQLAEAHGLGRTASVLGLDYYSLKKRIELSNGDFRSTAPAFVELSASPASTRACVIELQDEAGASMRVHLTGYDAPELAALSRSLWNGE